MEVNMSLQARLQSFLSLLQTRQGKLGRANGSFFSAQMVSLALHHLRLSLLDGAILNSRGKEFVCDSAAYLAWLAYRSFKRRGWKSSSDIDLASERPHIRIGAQRRRDGRQEYYRQDVLADVEALLLHPPKHFPSMYGQFHELRSLTMPSPEYLYLYGLYLMQSPRAEGNWPHGEQGGGLDEDFIAARALLVEDLHHDADLPVDDPRLRELSWWVVFPPCGWRMNEGQAYNLMTLVDQIAMHPRLPADDAIAYLRALLRSQMPFVRHLAARTLLVLDIAPRNHWEAAHYRQALQATDRDEALTAMAHWQHALNHDERKQPAEDWRERCERHWRSQIERVPPPWHEDPAASDGEFQRACMMLDAEGDADLPALWNRLHERYPNSWLLRVAQARYWLHRSEQEWRVQGEALLRRCLDDQPPCADAHLALALWKKRSGQRDEAMHLCEHALRRWPWDGEIVDFCMHLTTQEMIAFPGGEA